MSSDEILYISTLLAIALVIAYFYRLHQGTIYRNRHFLEEIHDLTECYAHRYVWLTILAEEAADTSSQSEADEDVKQAKLDLQASILAYRDYLSSKAEIRDAQARLIRSATILEEDLDGHLSNEVSILIIGTFNSNAEDGTTF